MLSERQADRMGTKAHMLYIDELRGGNVEAHEFGVANEKILQFMGSQVSHALAHVRQRASESERERTHATRSGGISVTTELQKLAALRDAGVLSEDEFAIQKARLLG